MAYRDNIAPKKVAFGSTDGANTVSVQEISSAYAAKKAAPKQDANAKPGLFVPDPAPIDDPGVYGTQEKNLPDESLLRTYELDPSRYETGNQLGIAPNYKGTAQAGIAITRLMAERTVVLGGVENPDGSANRAVPPAGVDAPKYNPKGMN